MLRKGTIVKNKKGKDEKNRTTEEEQISIDEIDLEKAIKILWDSLKDKPSRKNSEKIIALLSSNIASLVKQDIASDTFFISPQVEDIIMVLEKNSIKEIQKKTAYLKAQIFEFIQFQNTLFQPDSKDVSFYFLEKGKKQGYS